MFERKVTKCKIRKRGRVKRKCFKAKCKRGKRRLKGEESVLKESVKEKE